MAVSAGRHIIGENYSVSATIRSGDPSAAACGLRSCPAACRWRQRSRWGWRFVRLERAVGAIGTLRRPAVL